MASPLIKSLRSRYPEAYIAWLVQSEASELLTANPSLDEVIVWPRGDWRRLWLEMRWFQLAREIHKFIRLLRSRHFDMVIDLQGLLKSGIWARLTGAPVRIGLGSKEGSRLLMNQIVDKPGDDDRIGPEYRHLAYKLGLDYSEFDMGVTLTDEDIQYATQVIEDNELADGFVVVCPFTTRPQKHWVQDNWAVLAERVQAEYGVKTVILGGPDNRDIAEMMAARCKGAAVSLAGQTRLRQAAAIISKSSLLVGVDTGLTHIGVTYNIPTIAIFGSTRPYLETEHNNILIIYKYLECSPCGRNPTCGGAFTCMTSVTVDDVMVNVSRLLKDI